MMTDIKPPFEGQFFEDFDEWVRLASRRLTAHPEYNDTEQGKSPPWRGHHFKALCFDARGRRCRQGGDFMRARDEDAFPVWWIWPDQIPSLVAGVMEP